MGSLFGGTPQTPTPINPAQGARQQNRWNVRNAYQNASFNRLNQTDPYGNTLSYTQTGTDERGNPIFSVNQTASQGEMDYRNQLRDLGLGAYRSGLQGAQSSASQSPGDVAGLDQFLPGGRFTAGGGSVDTTYGPTAENRVGSDPYGLMNQGVGRLQGEFGGPVGNSQDAFNTAYGYASANLEPRFEQTRAATENRLRNQGLDPTSEAYRSQMNDVALQQNEARNNLVTGLQNQMFNQGLAGRQQGYNEASGLYGLGQGTAQNLFGQNLAQSQYGQGMANDAFNQNLQSAQFGAGRQDAAAQNAQFGTNLAGGLGQQNFQNQLGLANIGQSGIVNPVTQGQYANVPGVNVQGVDMMGLQNLNQQGQWNAYNAQAAQQQAMLSGLASIGGSLLAAPMTGGASLGGMMGGQLLGL